MADDYAQLREALDAERTTLLRRIDELTAGGEIELEFDDDFADRGQVSAEIGENRALADSLRHQLDQVEKAFTRLDAGTYGTCDVCNEVIGKERLAALPATSRCVQHA
jgi:DnaK suppressor protein